MDIPLFIKLIHGRTPNIIYMINFGIFCLTPRRNASRKKLQLNPIIKNLVGTKNLTQETVYCINIGTRKQSYHQVYKLYGYGLF